MEYGKLRSVSHIITNKLIINDAIRVILLPPHAPANPKPIWVGERKKFWIRA